MAMIPGARVRGQNRAQNLAAARQWRIDNKAYFDAIYGPETVKVACQCCGGTGYVDAVRAEG